MTNGPSGQAAVAGADGPTPASPRRVCSEPGCPRWVVARGWCEVHYQTTSERGYGPEWQEFSRELRAERGACEDCGSREDLTVDHVDPHSGRLGYRVRCRTCHARLGAKGMTPPSRVLPAREPSRDLMRVIG